MMKTWFDGPSLGLGAVVGSAVGAKGVGSLGLVDLKILALLGKLP